MRVRKSVRARAFRPFVALAFSMIGINAGVADALCGGTRYPLLEKLGPTPHVELTADSRPGQFLIDYGATQGTLWTAEGGSGTTTRKVALSLPGVASADFLVRHDSAVGAKHAVAGIIGTDVLSRVTLQRGAHDIWISAQACDASALRADGFHPIDQTGFFSTDRAFTDASRPNVPVLFLQFGTMRGRNRVWAQIDTGYSDVPGSNSIDINQALFDQLGGAQALVQVGDVVVVTCEGVETRPAYRTKDGLLAVTNEQGEVLRTVDTHRLLLKRADTCGGIASMKEPAAQLGASFLHALGAMIFEPRAHRVWIGEVGK